VVLGLLDRQFGKSTIAAVGHRIVHGGVEFTESVVLDDRKTASLYRLAPLAPLHQPHNLLGVRAARRASPEAAQVACFDNHRAHPWVNDTYALPRELYEQGIRHYGAVRGGVRITDHSVNFDSDQCAAM
jgi:acetate kinase